MEAAGDRGPILFDGGIRRGTDVLMALALGATAVGIGRPILWGLAVDGEAGVGRVLDILTAELEHVAGADRRAAGGGPQPGVGRSSSLAIGTRTPRSRATSSARS